MIVWVMIGIAACALWLANANRGVNRIIEDEAPRWQHRDLEELERSLGIMRERDERGR